MGCVDSDPVLDRFANMRWLISEDRASVVVEPVLPSELIYLSNHNDAIGELWQSHHQLFGEYVAKHMVGIEVYEVGGAHGLASLAAAKIKNISWTIHDINPTPDHRYKGEVIYGAFTRKSAQVGPGCTTIAHSHTLEHVHDSAAFIEDIARILPIGGRQIISWPNMRRMLERGDLNFLNFEHTAYLPEDVVTQLLARKGFRIVDREYFKEHSIFLTAEKIAEPEQGFSFSNTPEDLALFHEYFKSLEKKVQRFNAKLEEHKGPRFVFGAHVFTQMLIAAGLDQGLLDGCLDNSASKSGKRLYGTRLYSQQPSREILAPSADQPMVVMAIAEYSSEVKQQLTALSEGNCIIVE
jgi:SAM-dependent methyltransferase